ncbi:hypothetical protein ACFQJC_08025 [Haloferax namakaokahaiae]|uniref:DUF8173 domain-containing protein n=1 Tax=Haloferax namakaokahaiae TaxID=1748331 RepID=A0ABD5ZE78_9EURY
MVPSRSTAIAGLGLASLLAFVGVASAQSVPAGSVETASQLSPTIRGAATFIVDLVVGGILVAAAPRYTRNSIANIRDNPGESLVWGLGLGIGGAIVIFILAITVIGLIVAIPAGIALAILGIVGGAVATVLLGSVLGEVATSGELSLALALVVGAFVAAVLSVIPILGGLVMFVVDSLGLGIVGKQLYTSWSS